MTRHIDGCPCRICNPRRSHRRRDEPLPRGVRMVLAAYRDHAGTYLAGWYRADERFPEEHGDGALYVPGNPVPVRLTAATMRSLLSRGLVEVREHDPSGFRRYGLSDAGRAALELLASPA